jgi:serine/threonine protein kinase
MSSASITLNEFCKPIIDGDYKIYNVRGYIFEIPSHFTLNQILGVGAYGIVCSATDSKNNTQVAIKKCSNIFANPENNKRILEEIVVMDHFNNFEQLMPLLEVLPPRVNTEKTFTDVYMVMPKMDCSLQRIIRSRNAIAEHHRRYFIFQMLRGLKHLHEGGVGHFDLKPDNILVNCDDCHLRICDFGLAHSLQKTKLSSYGFIVTRWYRPLELLIDCDRFHASVDIWSAGLIAAEFYTNEGKPLFRGNDEMDQTQMICAAFGKPPASMILAKGCSTFINNLRDRVPVPLENLIPGIMGDKVAIDFFSKMLQIDPAKRSSAAELVQHPYFSEINSYDFEIEPKIEKFKWDLENKVFTEKTLREAFLHRILAPEQTLSVAPEQTLSGASSPGLTPTTFTPKVKSATWVEIVRNKIEVA